MKPTLFLVTLLSTTHLFANPSTMDQRINSTLKQPQRQGSENHSHPNCFGTVLFAHKVFSYPQYSHADMSLWLSSPFCKTAPLPAQRGDIIHLSYLAEPMTKNEYSYTGDTHSYLAISDKRAFNKSSPDPADPFEIIGLMTYMNRENEYQSRLPQKCRFIDLKTAQLRRCEFFSTLYRCDFERVLTSSPRDKELAKALVEKKNICLDNKIALKNKRSLEDVQSRLERLKEFAREKLGIMDYENATDNIRKIAAKYDPNVEEKRGPYRNDYLKQAILLSHQSMDLSRDPFLTQMALAFRLEKKNSEKSAEEIMLWSTIFSTEISQEEQYEMFCDN